MFGILTSKLKNCCTIGTFSFLALLTFVVFGILGALAIVVDLSSRQIIDDFCAEDRDVYKDKFAVNLARNFLDLFD